MPVKKIAFCVCVFLSMEAAANFASPINVFGPSDHKVNVSQTGDPKVFLIEYPGKKVFHDCETGLPRMAIQYVQKLDQPQSGTAGTLYFERQLPPSCQPKQNIRIGINALRIHNERGTTTHQISRLIPFSATAIYEAGLYRDDTVGFKTTNMFPVVREFANGPLVKYQQVVQCLRGQTDFLLLNGLIHRSKPDPFIKQEFGITPPDFFWSVMLLPNRQSFAFLFSNQQTTSRSMAQDIMRYQVSIEALERTLNITIPHTERYDKQKTDPNIPINKAIQSCSSVQPI